MSFNSLIIGLTGTNAAGKGEVADYLKKKGFDYHSLSDVIRDELKNQNKELSRENLISEGNRLRKDFGPSVLAKKIKSKINKEKTIVDSIRNTFELKELRELPNFVLLSIDAPVGLRFDRSKKRGRLENASSLKEFKAQEEKEKSNDTSAQQIDKCMEAADHTIINDGSMEKLYERIDEILKNYQTYLG